VFKLSEGSSFMIQRQALKLEPADTNIFLRHILKIDTCFIKFVKIHTLAWMYSYIVLDSACISIL
jgi:hypothetical protein